MAQIDKRGIVFEGRLELRLNPDILESSFAGLLEVGLSVDELRLKRVIEVVFAPAHADASASHVADGRLERRVGEVLGLCFLLS